MGKRFAILIGVAAAGVMALGTQSAAEHGDGQTVESRITIKAGADRFLNGDVKAGQVACVRRREVKVYSRRPGEDRRFEETTTTNRRGDWGLRPDGRWHPRRYFAVVTEKEKDGYLCTGDRSPGVMLTHLISDHLRGGPEPRHGEGRATTKEAHDEG